MKRIGITDLRNRLRNIPNMEFNNAKSATFREQADKAIELKFPSRIIFCIECGIGDPTVSMTEDTMFDLFDALAECGTESQIRKYGNLILNEYVSKTRDAKETQKYLKQKMGRAKSKITSKIQNNFDDLWNATKSTVGTAKSNFEKNTEPYKNALANAKTRAKMAGHEVKKRIPKKEEALIESYEAMLEQTARIISIDRILENYNRISKRFNIDRIIQENTVVNGIADTAVEVCGLIDTYDMPVKVRYNTALETVWYGLHKNGFTFNESDIVTAVSDFYMANGNNSFACKSILESSLIFDKGDYMGDIDVITEEEPEESVNLEVKYENDKGEKVPKKCPKCGSDVKVFFRGEPVFVCSNKDCEEYFGTVPFKEAKVYQYMVEGKLSAKERKNIKDSDYGIPSKRKYPMPDESHVRSAIQMFNHVDSTDEAELARNIKKKIKSYGMSVNVGKDNRFSKYYKPANEAGIIGSSIREFSTYNTGFPILESEDKQTDFNKIFNDYKTSNSDNKQTNKLMSVARKLYSLSPEQIIEGTPNFLSYIRGILVIGGFAINPIIGIIGFIADQLVSMHMKREDTAEIREAFKSEIRKVDKKIDSSKSQTQRDNLQKYRDALSKAYDKIDQYYEELLSEKELDDKYNAADDDDIKTGGAIDGADMEGFEDMFGDDFDIDGEDFSDLDGFEESGKFIILMNHILESYDDETCKEKCFDQHKCKKMIKMNPSIVGDLADVSDHYPQIISKHDLVNAIDDIRSDIQIGAVRINMMERYEINNVYDELIRSNSHIIPQGDIFYESTKAAVGVLVTKALNEIYSACVYYSPLTEASFTNSLKLASEKLKKSMQKLSDADKTISKKIDSNLSSFTRSVERAMTNDRRDAIIKGSVIPSASKIIKGAILTGAAGIVLGPVVAVIGVLGYLGASKKLNDKQRNALIDEIEIELKMCQKYIDLAESKNDLKSLKKLYTIQRELEKQRGRIKYRMTLKGEKYFKPEKLPTNGIET